MKKASTWLVGIFSILAYGTAQAQVNLAVENGFGSGSFAPGATRLITARTPQSSEVFSHWQFSESSVTRDSAAWMQFVVMPTQPLSATAIFKPFAGYQVQSLTINGGAARYAAPAGSAHTLLLRFHGSGGSAQNQFNPGENLYFSELALARGFAVASLDSVDRVNRQWNPAFNLSNPDVQNVAALIAELRQRNVISEDTPIVAQGTSNGAAFTSRVSALLNFKAQALAIAAGINPIVRSAQIPTCWVLNQNDSIVGTQAISDASASVAVLTTQNVRNALWRLAPTPVYPERFTRIRGVTLAQSRTIYDALRLQNALDSNDFLLINPANLSSLGLPPGFAQIQSDITEQLNLAFTEHQFGTNFMHLQLDFLQDKILNSGFE
jgi:predicted alpha/beta-hydrolase family hydrolase